MEDIRDFFRKSTSGEADFRELLHKKNDRYDAAVTFSSVLEMMKQNYLDAYQKYLYGAITVKATEHLFDSEEKEQDNGQ